MNPDNLNHGQARVMVRPGLVITRLFDNGALHEGETGATLDHPIISRRHARFEQSDGRFRIVDLGSTNGTFVNGVRVLKPTTLANGDKLEIGPFQFIFDGVWLTRVSRSGLADLIADGVGRSVPASGVQGRVSILEEANLTIHPGEFVCIVGPSGSGKSTLMNVLAGRVRPDDGIVSLGDMDLHENFETLKQDIAFVPQSDVLHDGLTLRQALGYTARLRLPADTSAVARAQVIDLATRSVGLADRLDIKIASLSGGQKKRASLASEILSRPSLLFLDEVTSGLDESTDREIMELLRGLTREEMTIVCVTHTLANIADYCDKIAVMGAGGKLVFYGPPAQALQFFGIRRLGELFDRLEQDGTEHWLDKYAATGALASTNAGRPSPGLAASKTTPRNVSSLRGITHWPLTVARHFAILASRNFALLRGDKRMLAFAALQSASIGLLIGYVFGDFGQGFLKASSQQALLGILGFSALWFGCNGASKEIVGELPIYRRERDVNLSSLAFLLAKFVVIGVFTVTQVALMMAVCASTAQAIPGGIVTQLAPIALASIVGVALGLVISAACDTRDQATTIVPLALVPQLVLSGMIAPRLPDLAQAIAETGISMHWIREAMLAAFLQVEGTVQVFDLAAGKVAPLLAQPYEKAVHILATHSLVLLGTAFMVLYRRHRPKVQ